MLSTCKLLHFTHSTFEKQSMSPATIHTSNGYRKINGKTSRQFQHEVGISQFWASCKMTNEAAGSQTMDGILMKTYAHTAALTLMLRWLPFCPRWKRCFGPCCCCSSAVKPGVWTSDIGPPDVSGAFWSLGFSKWNLIRTGCLKLGFWTNFRKMQDRFVWISNGFLQCFCWLTGSILRPRKDRLDGWYSSIVGLVKSFWEFVRPKGFWSYTSSRYFLRSFG